MIVDNDGQCCSFASFYIGGGTFTRSYDIRVNIFLAMISLDAISLRELAFLH